MHITLIVLRKPATYYYLYIDPRILVFLYGFVPKNSYIIVFIIDGA